MVLQMPGQAPTSAAHHTASALLADVASFVMSTMTNHLARVPFASDGGTSAGHQAQAYDAARKPPARARERLVVRSSYIPSAATGSA